MRARLRLSFALLLSVILVAPGAVCAQYVSTPSSSGSASVTPAPAKPAVTPSAGMTSKVSSSVVNMPVAAPAVPTASASAPPPAAVMKVLPPSESSSPVEPAASLVADANEPRVLAKKILDTQFGDDAKNKAGDTLVLVMSPLVSRDNPGKDKQITQIMQKSVVPVMATGFDDLEAEMVDDYVKTFTADELKQLLAFHTSSLGVKYKAFNLDMLNKMRDSIKSINAAKTQEAIHALVAQLKQSGLNVPKEMDH